ncbi:MULTISPECIES: cytochrome c oxidase subunit II [Mucilaginibacter]|jgi:cytochrome c oxidase subunit 2|uniref:Cytochrome c oxidase subunit 2 n=2 Tax=Mucilaginibacter TaxID=423349 RepID=A0AAE6JLV3_9SPHI|nr:MULTISPECIES: cytochrome c oxidase subunit II [Mucilaginibacter]NVM63795.1 cytochrome c oxidase subunit 2 [Mucilaginibacter sp. SG538B]QEM07756.1 cytochrome c oxidase subunit II [Mucilaginibacter rubeus]QEM20208.1 cytochrome c oxidase subunit II [Mucilaginibacter gossypii]QTE43076.1 cytochrome c oxidase subunit II [Mucilaginibacter rubeus]QTE49677.1 cytochrome c oxidase subunit II [Mucilaginibacter rubeus]
MGFRKLINSKKLLSFFAAFMLLGTNLLMAQTAAGAAPGQEEAPKVDWTGIAYYVLIFFLICLGVAIVGKILKIYDLTLKMQGKKGIKWNTVMAVICIVFLFVGLYGAYWSFTEQGSMTLPEAASAHGVKIDEMFTVTTVLTMIVFFVTQILLFTFLFQYRHSDKRRAHFLPHNNTIEKVWTIAPAIVLTILVVFGFFTWQKIMNSENLKDDINIDVTGHQFAWELRYPGKDGVLGPKDFRLVTGANLLGVNFKKKSSFDDLKVDTMYLPVNKSIRLNILAQDVIHSVYMPHFRVQLNAVPGLPTFFKFTPTITTAEMRTKLDDPKFEYTLYCNKICGGSHYNMQKVVRVVSEAEYQSWLSRQKPYLNDALRKELHFAAANNEQSGASTNRLALNN